jgi:Spy/CpxP family protein refolding chaperone
MAPLQDSIQEKFAQLRTLLTATQVDEEQVRATSEELSQLRSRSLQECVDCLIQLRQMLTPAELDALWECCAPTTSE